MRKRTARAVLKALQLVIKAQKIITKEVGILADAGEASSLWDDMLWVNGHLFEATDCLDIYVEDCLNTLKKH